MPMLLFYGSKSSYACNPICFIGELDACQKGGVYEATYDPRTRIESQNKTAELRRKPYLFFPPSWILGCLVNTCFRAGVQLTATLSPCRLRDHRGGTASCK